MGLERFFMDTRTTVAGFFSGVGGIELGFELAGATIVFGNDRDKYASTTYRANLCNEPITGGVFQHIVAIT